MIIAGSENTFSKKEHLFLIQYPIVFFKITFEEKSEFILNQLIIL